MKHEQSSDDLQRRLSQISGYKQQQQQQQCSNVSSSTGNENTTTGSRQATLDLARLVSRRLSSSMQNRINISVPVTSQDGEQDNLTVRVFKGKLSVLNIDRMTLPDVVTDDDDESNNNIDRCALHVEETKGVAADRLMCLYDDGELHIRERSKAIVRFDLSRLASELPLHCPVFSWLYDDTVWKVTWFLDAELTEQNISVRTVDNLLVIVYRSRRANVLPLHTDFAREFIQNEGPSRASDEQHNLSIFSKQNGVVLRNRGALQLTLELPDGVVALSVRAHISRDRLLVVEGQNNATFERSMTL